MIKENISDFVKLFVVELALIVVAIFGFISWALWHNTIALCWAVASLIVFVPYNVFSICFIVWLRKERQNESNTNEH